MVEGSAPGVAFLLSGQGAQYAGMAAALYRDEPVFRAEVDACCEALIAQGEPDLRPVVFAADGDAALQQTAVTQPALFVIEYALAQLWQAWGVVPTALIGHSLGEYVAACLAGVFTRDDALRLVALRGRLMQALPAGAMLAVPLSEAEVTPLLSETVSLAAVNGPRLCVVAGPAAAIAAVETQLAARGVTGQRLVTSHAFHSAMMAPILDTFEAAVAAVPKAAPRVPVVSNVTGTWLTAAEATSAGYWRRHVREAVRFAAGVGTLLAERGRVLLEVGPGRTLATLARQNGAAAAGAVVVTSLRHAQETTPDLTTMLQALAAVWRAGVPVQWPAVWAGESRRRVMLPTYPFERQRYWIEALRPATAAKQTLRAQQALVKKPDVGSWIYEPRWVQAPQAPAAVAGGTWIVFADERGIGDALVAQLRRDGKSVAAVRAGARFERFNESDYALNPADPHEYDALVAAVSENGPISRIAHLWSVDPTRATDEFAPAQTAGFYSVLFLAQALGRRELSKPVDLVIVGDRFHKVAGSDKPAAAKATVLGLARVIPQENPGIRCGTVDIAPEAQPTAEWIDLLSAEIAATPDGSAVALRARARLVQSYAPKYTPDAGDDLWIRKGGSYLITGGLGSVGLSIAERFARAGARLILVGRSGLPPAAEWQQWLEQHPAEDRVSRRIAAVRRLEALGAEVMVGAADVASVGEMRAVVAAATARFGSINGVVHAAGAMDGSGIGAVQALTREACEAQFKPKVRGAEVLDEILDVAHLDFCLATSSLSAILGGLSFGAYAAGNAFLDGLAERVPAPGRPIWTSVNLDGWKFAVVDTKNALADLEMTPAEGVESLARILSTGSRGRAVVSTGDLDVRIERYVKLTAIADADSSVDHARAPQARTPGPSSRPRMPRRSTRSRSALPRCGRTSSASSGSGATTTSSTSAATRSCSCRRSARSRQSSDESCRWRSCSSSPPSPRSRNTWAACRNRSSVRPVRSPPETQTETPWPSSGWRAGSRALPTSTCSGPTCATAWSRSSSSQTKSCIRAGVDPGLLKNPRYVRSVSTIDGIDLFDASFFGYAPREAELIDPQHRLFLECAWEALERAGYDPKRYPGLVGVFAGAGWNRYLDNIASHPDLIQAVGSLQAAIGQPQRPPDDTRVVQAEPARAQRQRADRLLDVARRRPPGVPQPRRRRVRHGAGRRRVARRARRKTGYLYSGRQHPLAGRALPRRSTPRRRARSGRAASASCC